MARVELRQLWRAKARTLLMMVLIAVPVAGLVGGSILLRITIATTDERVEKVMGRADLRCHGRRDALENRREEFPPNTRIDRLIVSSETIEVPGLRMVATRWQFAPPGLLAPCYRLLQGRSATQENEVTLSPLLMDLGNLQLGDKVTLASRGKELQVVGVGVDPERIHGALLATLPDKVPREPHQRESWFLKLENPTAAASLAAGLKSHKLGVMTAEEYRNLPNIEFMIILIFGGLGFVEAALVVAAAMAVGVRRRQREIGLLAASGASPGDVIGSILVSAIATAVVGSGIGMAVGVAGATLIYPHLDSWNGRLNGPFEFAPGPMVAAVAIGILTAVLAAAWPARGAALLPIRVALSGRRPPKEPVGWWLMSGLLLIGLAVSLTSIAPLFQGMAVVVLTLIGPVFGVLGFGACSPWILDQLAKRAAKLPLSWRLAVRDAGRFRSRNGPVVTAVLAGMALSVTLAGSLASIAKGQDGWERLRDDQLLVLGAAAEEASQRIAESLDGVARAPLCAARLGGKPVHGRFAGTDRRSWVAVGDRDLMMALGFEDPPPFHGRVMALQPGNSASVELLPYHGDKTLASLDALPLEVPETLREPGFVISEEDRQRLKLDVGLPPARSEDTWIVRLRAPLTEDLFQSARDVAASLPGTSVDANLLQRQQPRILYGCVLILSLLTGLLVVAVATTLSAVESKTDRVTLVTVGAPPSLSRRHAGAQAAFLSFLGCLLSIPAGLLPAFGAITSLAGIPFVVPWTELIVTALGLPLVSYLGAWLLRRPTPWTHQLVAGR